MLFYYYLRGCNKTINLKLHSCTPDIYPGISSWRWGLFRQTGHTVNLPFVFIISQLLWHLTGLKGNSLCNIFVNFMLKKKHNCNPEQGCLFFFLFYFKYLWICVWGCSIRALVMCNLMSQMWTTHTCSLISGLWISDFAQNWLLERFWWSVGVYAFNADALSSFILSPWSSESSQAPLTPFYKTFCHHSHLRPFRKESISNQNEIQRQEMRV